MYGVGTDPAIAGAPVEIPLPTETPTQTPVQGEPVNSNGSGLTAEYFNGKNLSNLANVRVDATVNISTSGSPNPLVGSDNFSIRWSGYVEPRYTETYQFCTVSDDGVRAWVNNVQLVNNWTDHGPTQNCGSIALIAGVEYPITMEFYENSYGAKASLNWSSPNQPGEIIPQSQLYPVIGQQPTVTLTPTVTPQATATTTPVVNGMELLSRPLAVSANNGADEDYVDPSDPYILAGKDTVRITYNLHGLCARGGADSAFIFNQAEWMYISLSEYGQNCLDIVQVVDVPLTDFWNNNHTQQINLNSSIGGIRTRFWYESSYTIEVLSAVAMTNGFLPTATATQTVTPTASATSSPVPTATNVPSSTPVATDTPVSSVSEISLLPEPWVLERTSEGSVEEYQSIDPNALIGRDTLRVVLDLNGSSFGCGDQSALIFDQNGWQVLCIVSYAENGHDGEQTIEIPLSGFYRLDTGPAYDPTQSAGTMHIKLWKGSGFTVEILSIVAFDSPNY